MGTKDRWWSDDTWPQGGRLTKALAAEGIAALVLDTQFHGERAGAIGYQPVEEYVCPLCSNARREMTIETVVDYRRALDYLATREDLDRKRVGAIGFSMGGLMTFALSAIDDRVRAIVPCVTPIRANDPQWSGAAITPGTFAPHVSVPVLMLMGRTGWALFAGRGGSVPRRGGQRREVARVVRTPATASRRSTSRERWAGSRPTLK